MVNLKLQVMERIIKSAASWNTCELHGTLKTEHKLHLKKEKKKKSIVLFSWIVLPQPHSLLLGDAHYTHLVSLELAIIDVQSYQVSTQEAN